MNLTNLANKFKYYAAIVLAEDGPQDKVRQELMKQGWEFKQTLTQEDAVKQVSANAMAGSAACVPFGRTQIYSPEGEEVFKGDRNKPLEARYKAEVRKAAAKVYDIN